MIFQTPENLVDVKIQFDHSVEDVLKKLEEHSRWKIKTSTSPDKSKYYVEGNMERFFDRLNYYYLTFSGNLKQVESKAVLEIQFPTPSFWLGWSYILFSIIGWLLMAFLLISLLLDWSKTNADKAPLFLEIIFPIMLGLFLTFIFWVQKKYGIFCLRKRAEWLKDDLIEHFSEMKISSIDE